MGVPRTDLLAGTRFFVRSGRNGTEYTTLLSSIFNRKIYGFNFPLSNYIILSKINIKIFGEPKILNLRNCA